MKPDKLVLLVISTFILFLPVQAQSYNAKQIELAEQLHSLARRTPPERAYIQTSKDIYETGEDLWFKVYLLNSQYLTPSLLSRTLYLQLFSEDQKHMVWQEKYEIDDGFASGRVYLESKLPEGDYILAAYTPNSFFNDTTEFKAVKKIIVKADITSQTIVPKKTRGSDLTAPAPGKPDGIQFNTFPEGGDLVSGLKSKVAFKAVNSRGEPVEIKGTLFEDNTPLIDFKSTYAGMGSFDFIPDASKKYRIRIAEPASDSSFFLPEIYPGGTTMTLVEADKQSLHFIISQSGTFEQEDVYLRVQCRGIVYGMAMGKLKRRLSIEIPLDELPQGIAEVTLFNSNLIPIAERLVYVNRDSKLNITAELSKEIYPTRGKAILKIGVKDENGDPVMANLGVSIFDKIYQNQGDSSNILTYFHLSTELKGRIYNPSFYFNGKNKERDEALDLLMLTQGWRRYVWNEMNLKKSGEPKRQVIFDGIEGELYYSISRRRIPQERLLAMAFSPNKDSLKVIIVADSTGGFTVSSDLLKRWENDFVYLKPCGPYRSQRPKKTWDPLAPPEFNYQIRMNEPFEIINHLMTYHEITYPLPGLLSEIENLPEADTLSHGVIRIKEVTIKGQKAKTIRGKYLGILDSLAMAIADEDYVCRYGVLNCPRHDRNEQGTFIPIQGLRYFVIYDYDTPGERTRLVTYWRPKYSEDELLKVNNLSRTKAYYGKREFYKPNYDKVVEEAIIPDFRNTLLWEPSVITNEKGEATLSFYCSDINTEFIGRIEGVGDNGLLGAGAFNFTVRKLEINH